MGERARPRRAGRGDDGMIAPLFVAVIALSLLVMAGVTVDGGDVMAARERAHRAAAQAARAAANQLQPGSVRDGDPVIDQAAARAAAVALLGDDGLTGSVSFPAPAQVSVSVTVTVHTSVLALIGMPSLSATSSATASAAPGVVTEQEG